MSIRGSIFSGGSRLAYRFDSDDITFDLMSLGELQQTEEDVLQRNWMLSLENDMYERFLTRYDPKGMKTITRILQRAKYARRFTSHYAQRSSRMSFRESIISLDQGRASIISTTSMASIQSGSRYGTPSLLTTGTVGDGAKITITHRMMMAEKEVEDMRNAHSIQEKLSARRKARFQAELEELEVRLQEIYETMDEFEEEVVETGVDRLTGKIPAERFFRFIEEWLKSANIIIERVRLKTGTIKMQIRKARQQLIQREDLGEALCAVDFDQLKIENQAYLKQIEEKNHYLLDMKRITGRYSLELTQHKQKLENLLKLLNAVKKEIVAKEQQIVELEAEYSIVNVDVEDAKDQLAHLTGLMEDFKVPDILDFVELQREMKDLRRTYKQLCRRKNIQQIMYKSSKKGMIQNKSKKKDGSSRVQTDSRNVSDMLLPVF